MSTTITLRTIRKKNNSKRRVPFCLKGIRIHILTRSLSKFLFLLYREVQHLPFSGSLVSMQWDHREAKIWHVCSVSPGYSWKPTFIQCVNGFYCAVWYWNKSKKKYPDSGFTLDFCIPRQCFSPEMCRIGNQTGKNTIDELSYVENVDVFENSDKKLKYQIWFVYGPQ